MVRAKMKLIAVTQRVDTHPSVSERRDALDQRWVAFLRICGYLPLLLPNQAESALALLAACQPQGLLLTGGNTLASLQGDAPERDATETGVLHWTRQQSLPVLGVCRGMQFLLDQFGVPLKKVAGHVQPVQEILIHSCRATVNSYHEFGAQVDSSIQSPTDAGFPLQAGYAPLHVWAWTDDGVVKAIRHAHEPICGIMWHPERLTPFRSWDTRFFKEFFG
ncbi:MAG: gamma-glutamyl-gamma-aminobutyrate hydrolase family protein [Magnetococcales bacterium]|nr:gamma-glutamyl-gamma-aminobutyrate hydrolase family protein [Magnetococcales bacterium]MBF0322039.1 gamma-glutamyl-gamma-aminobutyrate hydrolase family protein [Magnetococcales bacterium]